MKLNKKTIIGMIIISLLIVITMFLLNKNNEMPNQDIPIIKLIQKDSLKEATTIQLNLIKNNDDIESLTAYEKTEDLIKLLGQDAKLININDGSAINLKLEDNIKVSDLKIMKIAKDDLVFNDDLTLNLNNSEQIDLDLEINIENDMVYLIYYPDDNLPVGYKDIEIIYAFLVG